MSIFKKIKSKIQDIESVTERVLKEKWHSLKIEEVYSRLQSPEQGLSSIEAVERLKFYGKNELPEEESDPAWKLFLRQFNSPLMYIMMVAIFISFFVGHTSDTYFIIVVVVSNAIVGFYQEHKANKSLNSLKNLIKQKTRVLRSGREQEVDVSSVVPGDIVILRAGDKIPADGRIIEYSGLKVNEAPLTGESRPIDKNMDQVSPDVEIGDRTNMVFMGTLVEEGSAKILVVETGVKTEYGDIVRLLEETKEEPTPLQRTVVYLSKVIGIFITLVVVFIVGEGYLAGRPMEEIFSTALALFVSAIPEGLLPAITIVLTLGMRRILRYKGLVRRLAATETLGGVTVICTDKTGTLTEGKMQVSKVVVVGEDYDIDSTQDISNGVLETMEKAVLCADAYIENPESIKEKMIFRGRPTEQAILKAGVSMGIIKNVIESKYKQIDSVFFSSERKFSASLRDVGKEDYSMCVIGAPERILERVSFVLTPNGVRGVKSEEYKELMEELDSLIKRGFRVVASAYKNIPVNKFEKGSLEKEVEELILVGFIALDDPVRPDVAKAFHDTKRAGIKTIIITGDHRATAQAVASKIGFNIEEDEILEGHNLEKLSDLELSEKIGSIKLYSRVSPRHKLRIVKLLQEKGEVVAMFGDGVNDAPALKAADIGVAVNSEVDAAREVADIVLLDSSFSTIVKAIEQGRIIFANIRRVFLYLITQDFSQFFLFLVSIAIGLPLPLVAVQLLLVNLVESGLPDLALTTEEEKDGVMDEPPRNPKESILHGPSKYWMIYIFTISGGLAFILYYLALQITENIELTRTMLTAFLCMESLFLALSLRSFKKNIIRKDLFSNGWITSAVIISFGALLLSIYWKPMASVLYLVPLSLSAWMMIVGTNVFEILLVDHFKRRFFK